MTDEELRKIAENATPGPWVADPANAYDTDDHGGFQMQASVRDMDAGSITWDDHGGEVFKPADAEFIATFNPELVVALLDRVEKAERERDDLDMKHSLAAGHLELAYEALQRVRELHQPRMNSMSALYPEPLCSCQSLYPCPTIRALEGNE